MVRIVQRGLDKNQEQDYSMLIRDTRTMGQRITDFFRSPETVTIMLGLFAVSSFIVPAIADLLFIFGITIFLFAHFQKTYLPFRLPKNANCIDYNSQIPGTNKYTKAEGIYFIGNDKKNGEELWLTNVDMRTHMLMFGSTGSGKTESLISIAYNALIQSSGFIYVDGKGDNSLFAKVFSMVRYMGREDDMLLINFMTGARDIIGPQEKRLSNTMNPFARGSSSMLAQLVVSLMDAGASNSPDADMWKGRAIAFVEALMKILVAMRDAEYILLDANTVRNYFTLERLEAMVMDKLFVRDNQEPVNIENLPPVVIEPIANYLINLPGYNKEKKGKQVSQVYEQHGFITMQLTRVFTSLADTYGHILRTKLAEVDMRDVVLNRRLLVVLLPALEKSPDELANLGKIIIATMRAMMAAGLGEEVEGKYKDMINRKPTNADTPFLCILDEYGYYAVPGFAIVPAQARALGFSVIFAGQDLPALQKASKEEAATIGANTNIKICMKLEDPLETWDFFMKTAGESYVTHVSGFQTDARSISNQYMDTRSAQLEKRARIDLLDLKEQVEGEAHIFFKSRIIRARMFYANPPPVKEMRLNQLLKVDAPSDVFLRDLNNCFVNFDKVAKKDEFFVDVKVEGEDISRLVENLNKELSLPPIERGVSTLMAFREQGKPEVEIAEEAETVLSGDELDVFAPLRMNDYLKDILVIRDVERFSKEILSLGLTRDQVAYIERLSGKTDNQATNISRELIKDMQVATHYPPTIQAKASGQELSQIIANLIEHIALRKNEHAKKGGDF